MKSASGDNKWVVSDWMYNQEIVDNWMYKRGKRKEGNISVLTTVFAKQEYEWYVYCP